MNMFEELNNEQRYLEYLRDQKIEEGKEIGKKEVFKKVIQNLLNQKMPISQIAQVVDLPEEEVTDIINEVQNK